MPIPFSIRQLEYFVAVSANGTITKAAQASNVAQPSISLALSQLEESIGSPLFQRRPGQGIALTPLGKRILVEATQILRSARRIAQGELEDEPLRGELAISSYRDLGPFFLPRILSKFGMIFPEVRFVLREGSLPEVHADLLEGRSEIALTYDINIDDKTLEMDTLAYLKPHALLPRGHRLLAKKAVELAELAENRVIVEDMPVTNEYTLSIFWAEGILPKNIQYVQSFEMQRGLIANGWGVGISCVRPQTACGYDGSPIEWRPLAVAAAPQRVVLGHLGKMMLSRPAEVFLKHAPELARELSDAETVVPHLPAKSFIEAER